MKNLLNGIIRLFLTAIIGIAIAFILLIIVYMLPTKPMYNNLKETAKTMDLVGIRTFPQKNYFPTQDLKIEDIIFNNKCTVLDNYTDAIMLNTAGFVSNENAIKRAMSVERYENSKFDWMDPTNSMVDYVHLSDSQLQSDNLPKDSYARYWHGYLVILKPLMVLFNYNQIRVINAIIQIILLISLVRMLYKKIGKEITIIFIYSWLFIFPVFIPLSLQYSWVYYVMMLASIFMVKHYEKMNEKELFSVFFLVVGMITSYVDLLTYPLVTLGIPITIYMWMNYEDWKKKCVRIIQYAFLWGIGYGIMWSSKWILASIVLKKNIILDALSQVAYRTGNMGDSGIVITPISALVANFSVYSNFMYVILIIFGLSFMVYKMHKNGIKLTPNAIPYILCLIMPIVWYCVLKQHSFYHGVYTYKALMVTVFAGMSMLLGIGGSKDEQHN